MLLRARVRSVQLGTETEQLAGLLAARRRAFPSTPLRRPCFHSVNGRAHCFTRARQRGAARCIADEWSRDSSESSFLHFPSLPSLFSFSFSFSFSFFLVCFAHPYANGGSIPRFQTLGPEENSNLWPNPLIFQPTRALLFASRLREFRSLILRCRYL